MTYSEIKKEAKKNLKGKWGTAVCIMLEYMLVSFVIQFILSLTQKTIFYFLSSIIELIISVPLSFSLILSFIKLKKGENIGTFDFLTHLLDNFIRAWTIFGNILLKLLLPIIIIIFLYVIITLSISNNLFGIIPDSLLTTFTSFNSSSLIFLLLLIVLIAILIWFFIKSLLYVLVYPISYNNPQLTSKEVVNESAKLMKGNRFKYFLLQLSFINWIIPASLIFGIGFLWLTPYIEFSTLCLYDSLIKKSKKAQI